MSAARRLKINDGGSAMLLTSKSIDIQAPPIDITDDGDSGWRSLDDDFSVRSVDIPVEGITKDAVLRAAILAGTPTLKLTDITVTYPNGDSLSGDFYLNNLSEGGEHGDALKFSAQFMSSEAITYTAA